MQVCLVITKVHVKVCRSTKEEKLERGRLGSQKKGGRKIFFRDRGGTGMKRAGGEGWVGRTLGQGGREGGGEEERGRVRVREKEEEGEGRGERDGVGEEGHKTG